MSGILLFLSIAALFVVVVIVIDKKQRRVMREGKLLKSEVVCRHGERFYVEKVGFKDWHICIHSYYLISDRLTEGHTIMEQRWDYNDFCP